MINSERVDDMSNLVKFEQNTFDSEMNTVAKTVYVNADDVSGLHEGGGLGMNNTTISLKNGQNIAVTDDIEIVKSKLGL